MIMKQATTAYPTELADRLRGVLTALVTPFTDNGDLDLVAVDDHIEFQVGEGVRAVVVCGSIGEYAALTLRERRQLAERAATASGGRTAVLVGVTHQRPAAVRELARHAAEIGADGLLVSAPPLFKLTDSELREFWTWFADTVSLPWILYAAADARSGSPAPELLDEIANLPGIAAYKEPAPHLSRLDAVLDVLRGRIPSIAAAEVILPDALAAGAQACMTATACFAPAQLRRLVQAVEARDTDATRIAFAPVRAFRAHFQATMSDGFPAYIPYTKAACDLVGLRSGPPRRPLQALSDEERSQLDATLLDHGLASHEPGR